VLLKTTKNLRVQVDVETKARQIKEEEVVVASTKNLADLNIKSRQTKMTIIAEIRETKQTAGTVQLQRLSREFNHQRTISNKDNQIYRTNVIPTRFKSNSSKQNKSLKL
jgi:hypothetical protein